jgi:hypothetical protein
MSVAREPGLFRCAISYACLSDVNLMYSRGVIGRTECGENYLKRAIGKEQTELDDYSPGDPRRRDPGSRDADSWGQSSAPVDCLRAALNKAEQNGWSSRMRRMASIGTCTGLNCT